MKTYLIHKRIFILLAYPIRFNENEIGKLSISCKKRGLYYSQTCASLIRRFVTVNKLRAWR